jgi:hypothetical protein
MRAQGLPVEGICLYPVLDYADWENERQCVTGLLSSAQGPRRERAVYEPLADELERQQALFSSERPSSVRDAS